MVRQFRWPFEIPKVNYRKYRKDDQEPDLVPMCCGGVFATLWGQLSSEDSPVTLLGWKVITDALSRGDNIEEGHYMERSGQILCRGPPTLCL